MAAFSRCIAPSDRVASYERSLQMLLDSASHLDVARAEIQKDLDYLPLMTVELKRRMNARVPLLCLPTEVIMEIALQAADVWPAGGKHPRDDFGRRKYLGWIHFGHVCHTLREVLISHRVLWAENMSIYPSALYEFAQRSRDCPFNLDLARFDRKGLYLDAVDFLASASHISYARVLSVPLYSEEYLVDNGLDWPFPPAALSGRALLHLERLTIDFSNMDNTKVEYYPHFVTEETYQLPPIRTPRLQFLHFRSFYVPFDSDMLSSLELGYSDDPIIPRPPVPQFLDMLSSCHNLKHLGLQCWIPHALASSSKPTIFLPSLVELAVIDGAARVVALLSHLQFPRTAVLHIDLYQNSIEWFSMLQEPLKLDDRNTVDGLCFRVTDVILMICAFMSAPAAHLARQLSASSLPEESYPENSVLLLQADPLPLTSAVPFGTQIAGGSRLRYLGLEFDLDEHMDEYDISAWHNMLSAFTNVHTLCIDYIQPILAPLTALSAEAGSQPLLLPSLRHLWIADFSGNQPPSLAEQDDFVEFLLARKRAGFGLERLRIDKFKNRRVGEGMRNWLEGLRGIVPTVESEVDGSVVYEGWRGVGLWDD